MGYFAERLKCFHHFTVLYLLCVHWIEREWCKTEQIKSTESCRLYGLAEPVDCVFAWIRVWMHSLTGSANTANTTKWVFSKFATTKNLTTKMENSVQSVVRWYYWIINFVCSEWRMVLLCGTLLANFADIFTESPLHPTSKIANI